MAINPSKNIKKVVREMHPALDVVGDVLYVSVKYADDSGVKTAILTSDGESFTEDEWVLEAKNRGLSPRVSLPENIGIQWTQESIVDFVEGTLEAPTFKQAYDTLYAAFSTRLEVRDERYLVVLVLFTMMTYFHPLFDFLPILHLRGLPESGKSKAASLIGLASFNGRVVGAPTPASIYRLANEGRYTQVLTEMDMLAQLDSSDQFVSQLQSACSKSEAIREVTEQSGKQQFKPVRYYMYNPRVLASTKGFKSHPLRTRSIRLDFVKTVGANEKKLRSNVTDDMLGYELRDPMYKLLLTSWQAVASKRDELIDTWHGVQGRTFDKWLPLATMASLVSNELFEIVRDLAEESLLEQQADAEETFESSIIKFMVWVVDKFPASETVSSSDLYEWYILSEDVGDNARPKWARDVESDVTVQQVTQWVKSGRKLVAELQRQNMLDKEAKHTKIGNVYVLHSEKINGIARAYMGQSIFDRLNTLDVAEDLLSDEEEEE